MARKSVERSLPRLESLFPGFRGCLKEEHHLHLAIDYLRTAARRLRKTKNQPFYSMREASRFLSVPLRTVALAYQELENEGLITRIRSSRTVLLGKVFRSQHPGRGIVTVPVPMESIYSSYFTRTFCARFSEELWRHHFVGNLLLCTHAEMHSAEFAERIAKQSDIIVWLFPDRSLKETILTVRDHGGQNVLLCPIEDQFLQPTYFMDWTLLYLKVIRAWKREGIRHIVVAKAMKPQFQRVIEKFLLLLEENKCDFTLAEMDPFDLREKTEQSLRRENHTACALLEHDATYQICNREPTVMAEITTRCRVLFGRGVIHVSHFSNREYRGDVVTFSGDDVARRVACDLGSRLDFSQELPHLSPRWLPQANLGDLFI